MYNNLKQGVECSLDSSKCTEYESEIDTEQQRLNSMQQQAENLIANRCIEIHHTKKGTIPYMDCQERVGGMYRIDLKYDGIESAYKELKNTLYDQEKTCENYGMKAGTSAYATCMQRRELSYMRIRTARTERQAQKLNNRVNCQTQTIFGTTYTTCE